MLAEETLTFSGASLTPPLRNGTEGGDEMGMASLPLGH